MPAAAHTDRVWHATDTSPGAIESALRGMLTALHAENAAYVPARVLNLVCIVDRQWKGEVANRLAHVGRYHPSRTVICAVEEGRTTLDARATIAAPEETRDGEYAATRETVVVDCGPQHLPHLDSIVDPLVVSDLSTMVWSPHGHRDAVRALLHLSQIVLLDSVDEFDPADAIGHARALRDEVYVVDLAWLRSTPWRERIAATFDPVPLRPELRVLSAVTIRHHPDSAVAGLLLVGWLASRLGWRLEPLLRDGRCLRGRAHGRRQDVELRLEPARDQAVRGLAGVELATASGRFLRLDRGPGGLRAHYRRKGGAEREWTVLGASRGEAGILGEGIRQALLRDPTYGPALDAAAELVR